MFKRSLLAALAVPALLSAPAHAGPHGDDLARCLVESTSTDDRVALVRWMFTAVAAHPAVASIASVTEAERDAANKATGEQFVRLLTESCLEKARAALRYEGPAALQQGFQVVGQVAAGELFTHPNVAQAMAGLQKHTDASKLELLRQQ